jgi:branched-chain amino acid transport system permease protein
MFAAAIVLLLLPLLTTDTYLLRIITMAAIFAIYAASWDLLVGFAGQVSLGHSLFFGVSAYAAALLNLRLGLSPLLSVPAGALAAVLAGLLLSLPALRLRGPYFSLASLAMPIILLGSIFTFPDLTGGELGLSGISRLAGTRREEYYFILLAMFVLTLLMWKIVTSKTGLIFHAIREDEIVVRASGINTSWYKILAFCCSGFFAGLAGGLYAHFLRVIGPSALDIMMSLQVIIWGIFGGVVTIYGPVIGVFVLYPLLEYLRAVAEWRMLIFAAIVIITLRFMPEGVSTWVQDRLERECPRCKERNIISRKECRVCCADIGKCNQTGKTIS